MIFNTWVTFNEFWKLPTLFHSTRTTPRKCPLLPLLYGDSLEQASTKACVYYIHSPARLWAETTVHLSLYTC